MSKDALRAEAERTPVQVDLGDKVITVPHLDDWPVEGLEALLAGEYTVWAETVLNDRSLDVWAAYDPTLAEEHAFAEDWLEASGTDLGQIVGLEAFLDEHSAAVEADLLAHYNGVDLLDLWRGGLSHRRLWVLIQHLPVESATHTELRESRTDEELAEAAKNTADKYGRWSHTDLLIAQLIDFMALTQWTLTAVNTEKGKQPKPPDPYPRPGVRRRTATGLPSAAALAYLEAMRAEHRQLVGGDDG